MNQNVDNAERIIKALTDAEALSLFTRLGVVPPKGLLERVRVLDSITHTGRCCSLFNGYTQHCLGSRYNAGHGHPCTGCHDCTPERFPLDNGDVYWLKRWYEHGAFTIWNRW